MANTKKSTGKRRGPKPKKTEFYVDPRELKQELINFYKTEECSRELGDMIHKIAHGLSYSSNFINYTYRDEMVGDALVKMYTAVTNKKFKEFKNVGVLYTGLIPSGKEREENKKIME